MKKVVGKLSKKISPEKTDDLLEVDPKFEPVVRAFARDPLVITDSKQPWVALAREVYRFVKSAR